MTRKVREGQYLKIAVFKPHQLQVTIVKSILEVMDYRNNIYQYSVLPTSQNNIMYFENNAISILR